MKALLLLLLPFVGMCQTNILINEMFDSRSIIRYDTNGTKLEFNKLHTIKVACQITKLKKSGKIITKGDSACIVKLLFDSYLLQDSLMEDIKSKNRELEKLKPAIHFGNSKVKDI